MTRVLRLMFAALLPAACLPPVSTLMAAAPPEAATALGTWLSANGQAAIRIAPCPAPETGFLCGRIAWLKQPLDDAGKRKTDTHNPDPALATRPICGLMLLWHFARDQDVRAGNTHWSGGFVYDPQNGEIYHASLTARADGTLALRGYIGIPLLGESQIWTRATASQQSCG